MEYLELMIMFVIGAVLCNLPFLGNYFRTLNTLYHEDGHASVNLVTAGKNKKIELLRKNEGKITYSTRLPFAKILVGFAGYPFAALITYIMVFMMLKGMYLEIMYLVVATSAINLILWVRNFYGIFWLLTFGSLVVGTYFYVPEMNQMLVRLMTAIMIYENLAATFVIMKMSFKTPKECGDASSLRESTKIPSQIWGIIFFAIAIYSTWEMTKITL